MWKKLLISILVLAGTFSIGYTYYDNQIAAAGTYQAGGSVNGRVNIAPNGITGDTIGFQKGDKILMETTVSGVNDTSNPYVYHNEPLSWILIQKDSYTDYASDTCTPSLTVRCNNTNSITSWISMTTKAIDKISAGLSVSDYIPGTIFMNPTARFAPYTSSNLYSKMNTFNASLSAEDQTLIAPRNLSYGHNVYSISSVSSTDTYRFPADSIKNAIYSINPSNLQLRSGAFIPSFHEFWTHYSAKPSNDPIVKTVAGINPDTAFYETGYWSADFYHDNVAWKYTSMHFNSCGTWGDNCGGSGNDGGYNSVNTAIDGSLRYIRPSAWLDLNNVVFAISQGSSNDIAKVKIPELVSGYTSIMDATNGYKNMKLRVKNSALNAALLKIEDRHGNQITQMVENNTIYLNASANAGTSSDGVNTVSVLVFDTNGKFLYYRPLESAKGSDTYAFDLIGIPVGNYKISIVNEVYNESSTAPADCSELSDIQPLEIVKPLSDLAFKAKNDLQFNNNVNVGDSVGTISSQNGAGTPAYTIVSNPNDDSAHFEIGSDGKTVIVKGNALNAGTYNFKIQAQDENGDPITPLETSANVTVSKNKLNITFDDPNQTKKSITDASTVWNETATANPTTSVKVTYSVSGGDVGLIDINPNTGAITYKGSNAFGKVKIKAAADDDPTMGNDNYDPVDAEKEIVIYREVDGNVTPDNNSSDSTIPTFSASDANVKINGIIGTIQGSLGTPDTIGGSTITYTYGLKTGVGDANFFSVDPHTGVIKSTANLGVKAYSITVTVSDKWSTKEIPVTINVGVANAEDLKFYENSTSNIVITTQSAKITDTNVFVYATVKGSSNTNPVTYKVKDGSTNVVEVNTNSGKITPKGVGSVTIVAEKAGASGQAKAVAELTFTITAGEQDFIYTDATLSNELPKTGGQYDAKEEVYDKGKTFQLYTSGYPSGATVTYQLKAGSPTDVISVDSNGLVHILNASISPSQIGKVIVEATSHDPGNHYADKTIELPINIKKADQTISFADITYAASGKGEVTPVINEQDISSNDGGVQVNDTDYYITIDSSINTATAWTNNGVDIEYDFNGTAGLNIPLHVEKAGNRNYNKAEANGSMRIMGPDESTLAINRPGKIIYGDHFEIKSLQDDSGSTNVQYQFDVDNTTYISNPTVNGHKAEFDALKFSGNTSINIKVTRTADGETPLSKTISVQVLPKEIEITIDDKEKYKGEENPTLTYQNFKSQLVSWNGVQDVIQEHDIKLSTTAQTNSQSGSYPIKGDANSLNNTYPNYSFKFVEGTLTIKEDNIEDDWYHMEIADGSHTLYTGDWTNQDVDIISDHPEYINLSLDQSTWNPQKVTVSKEGETNQSFWMKKDSGAITKEKQEIIRIDKTPPKVKGIKAKDTNNKLQDIINQLSGGIFFQPGTAFEITTSDENSNLKVSETKEISYKIYKIESTERSGEEEISNGTLSVTNEKASITISETTGTYRICVIPTDNAGNSGEESCHEVTLKKIDVDIDGDGKPDFNDPDGDGCPDLNIKWKDPDDPDKWIIINGDRDYDGIPDLNIDSDGDGKADLNIDTDQDGKPDLNLVILKKTDSQGTPAVWKPTKCVKKDITKGILEEYCTGTNVKPIINVDLDNDGIPDINIDNKGDFRPHLNIAKDGVNPIINITTIHDWKPLKDYKSSKFTYDSIGTTESDPKPELNIDSDGDGYPDLNLDLDKDGVPDLNVDVDGDYIPDMNIDSTGDGKPDISVDTTKDGKPDTNIVVLKEWKPERNVEGDFPYDTMDITKPQEPSDPDNPQEPINPTEPVQQGNASGGSVQGYYHPQESVGGASTGDTTNLMMYLGISLGSLGILVLVNYKKKAES